MASLVLLLVLMLVLPSVPLAVKCRAEISFAVVQREPSKTELDGGIYLVSFKSGVLKNEVKLTAKLTGERPSYVAVKSGNIFSTNAIVPGELRKIRFSRKARFVRSMTASSNASRSTHVSVLGKVIAVANFGGSVATFRSSKRTLRLADEFTIPPSLASKLKDGSLSGIFAAPHPHMVFPYRKGVLVPDLGSDLLWYFGIDKGNGRLRELSRTALRIGDGPRHVVLHRKTRTIYLVNQVSVTVVVLREGSCGSGRINECDRRALLDTPEVDGIAAAAIRISNDARFLYVSVRLPDDKLGKIVVFRLDSRTGDIVSKVGEFSSCGVHPRDFDIVDGVMHNGRCTSFVAIANRDSNNVVLLKRDVSSGELSSNCQAISTSLTGPISIVKYQE